MAFLKTNYRRAQFVARAVYTALLDSNEGHVTMTFGDNNYPPPADVNDIIVKPIQIGYWTLPLWIGGAGSLSGNYLYLSIWASGYSAARDATYSVRLAARYLVGSR